MESIVNYESDDGNLKLTNKSKSKDLTKKKRRYSSDDDTSDSSDSSSYERGRKHQNEDEMKSTRRQSPSPSPSPRKSSSHKSSRSSTHKSQDNRHDRRRRSSSKDSDKYERKKKKDRDDDREDKKRHRRHSRDRERDRSSSHDKDARVGKNRRDKERERERDRSSERRKDRYDDRKRYNRHDDDYRHGKRDEQQSYRNDARNSDARSGSSSSNSSSAIRRAEALNRAIERRANEKVQQLQKLGIEIPAIMQQLKPSADHQTSQIRPLMSITTGITGGVLPQSSVPPATIAAAAAAAAAATATANDETKAEGDNLSLNLSNFTSSVLTNAKYTEQMQKKKLIWGAKKTAGPEVSTNNKWEAAKFSQDSDGKVASKFLRLMGMKNAPPSAAPTAPEHDADDSSVQKREQMFSSMEQQYEIARQVTHTMRGVGLGFGSQSRPC